MPNIKTEKYSWNLEEQKMEGGKDSEYIHRVFHVDYYQYKAMHSCPI
jgi:hypothetical protein